ncbi:uncharacterized protein TNCV_2172171 [Trichonephila clavipes]|nr:uncharacterized protein TNCV_2172171 [Trichonephila clavipes]
MRLQKRKGTVDGYEWRCRNQSKDNRHDVVRSGLGSNPGESMNVCKCIVPLWHGGTLNSHRAASSLVRLVEGEESWEASDHLWMFSLKIGVEPSQIVLSPA